MPRRARRKQLADVSVYVASALESVAAEVPTRTVVLDEETTAKPTAAQATDDYRSFVERGDRSAALQNITAWLREETHASGAAIALRVGEEVVCVASAGTAPPVGVTIDPSSGISGACIQSGQLTVCNDSATDLRVNPAAGHYIRSIVASPIKTNGRMEGLIEILSSTSYAFDRNHRNAVEHVAEVVSSGGMRPRVVEERPALLPVTITHPDDAYGVTFATNDTPNAIARTSAMAKKLVANFQTWPRKTKIAMFVAPVLLGGVLMVWSVGGTSAADQGTNQPVLTAVEPAPAAAPTEQPLAASVPQSDDAASTTQQPAKTAKKKVTTESAQTSEDQDSLITLQPVQSNLQAAPRVKDEAPMLALATAPSVTKVPLGGAAPVPVLNAPSQRSGGELIHKVTPSYPRTALALRLSGKVELMASVGPNGHVSKVRVLAGEPQFVQAAVEAVGQWRYKPLLIDGRPTTQEVPVNISFKPHAE